MRQLIVLVGALLAGCGPSSMPEVTEANPAAFRDEREELSYLSSLSNPTVKQWRRREELRRIRVDEDRQWERDRERERDTADLSATMARARELERIAPSAAWVRYKDVVERFPGSPEAKEAAEAVLRLEQAGYAIKSRSG
jgi:hypothetical protein